MRAIAVLTYVCGGGESASARGRRRAMASSMACRFSGGLGEYTRVQLQYRL